MRAVLLMSRIHRGPHPGEPRSGCFEGRRLVEEQQRKGGTLDIHQVNDLLAPGYLPFESGYADLGDGRKVVAALTRMPGCRAKMVDWWFSWLGGTDQYKLLHPTDHLFSDWENRIDGRYIGGAHLVHEYLAGPTGPIS